MSTHPASQQQPDGPGGRTSTVWPALTIALAVVAAVLAFLLLRPEGAQSDEGTGAAADTQGLTTDAESAAAAACEVLNEVDAGVTDMGGGEGQVVTMQLAAAATLAMVAEAHGESYSDLRADLELPRQVMMRMYSMDNDEYRTALADARAACAAVVESS